MKKQKYQLIDYRGYYDDGIHYYYAWEMIPHMKEKPTKWRKIARLFGNSGDWINYGVADKTDEQYNAECQNLYNAINAGIVQVSQDGRYYLKRKKIY